jgi:hypothetical protein
MADGVYEVIPEDRAALRSSSGGVNGLQEASGTGGGGLWVCGSLYWFGVTPGRSHC